MLDNFIITYVTCMLGFLFMIIHTASTKPIFGEHLCRNYVRAEAASVYTRCVDLCRVEGNTV